MIIISTVIIGDVGIFYTFAQCTVAKKVFSVYRRPLKQLLHKKIGNMEQLFNSPELGSSDIDNR
jgi:hypothetical protein